MKKIMKAILSPVGKFFAKHHNQIQFFAFETANIAFTAKNVLDKGLTEALVNTEGAATISFIAASGAISRFDFEKRPTLLFYGGAGLTIGGAFLAASGYPVSGSSVSLASLETARGGLKLLKQHIDQKIEAGETPSTFSSLTYKFGSKAMTPYTTVVESLFQKFNKVGEFANNRPFVTGLLIKAPLRMELVVRNIPAALRGDVKAMIDIGVGLSWTLGDAALSLNDSKLKKWVEEKSGVLPETKEAAPGSDLS